MRAKTIAAALLAMLCQGAMANDGYWFDGEGRPVMTSSGDCWRTQRWAPGHALAACRDRAPSDQVALVIMGRSVSRPVPVRSHVPVETRVSSTGRVLFATGSSIVPEGSLPGFLEDLAGMDVRGVSIVSEGSADHRGSKTGNAKLSKARADAALSLVNQELGYPSSSVGLGAAAPRAACKKTSGEDRDACLAPDRRADVTVTADGYARR